MYQPPPDFPQPLPMTPPPNPPHYNVPEEGHGGLIGYVFGTFLIIIGVIIFLVMFYLSAIIAGLGASPPPLYQLVLGPATTIFSGVLTIILWWKRDKVIAWGERVFRGR